MIRNPNAADHLRMRLVLHAPDSRRARAIRATARSQPDPPPAPRPDPSRASSRRSTSAPTAFTWWSRATRTASWSSSIACARWCAWPPASARMAASTRTSRRARSPAWSASASACATCMPTACACVGTNALRIARRKQAFLERAREALGHPDRDHLRHGGGAPDLLRRGAQPAERAGHAAWWSTSAAAAPSSSSARASSPSSSRACRWAASPLSERFFGDGRISAKRIERARLAARTGARADAGGLPRRGWDHAVGSSGTVRAIADAIRELDPQAPTITPAGLRARARVLHRRGPHARAGPGAPSPRTAARCSPAAS